MPHRGEASPLTTQLSLCNADDELLSNEPDDILVKARMLQVENVPLVIPNQMGLLNRRRSSTI